MYLILLLSLSLSLFSGMFNVPHVTTIYLIKKSAFDAVKFEHKELDPDMAMSDSLRDAVSDP